MESYRSAVVCRPSRAGAHGYPRDQPGMNRDRVGRARGACPSLSVPAARCLALGRKGPCLE